MRSYFEEQFKQNKPGKLQCMPVILPDGTRVRMDEFHLIRPGAIAVTEITINGLNAYMTGKKGKIADTTTCKSWCSGMWIISNGSPMNNEISGENYLDELAQLNPSAVPQKRAAETLAIEDVSEMDENAIDAWVAVATEPSKKRAKRDGRSDRISPSMVD
jgi:hypothetical protein